MPYPGTYPVISLYKMVKTGWTETNPGTATVTFTLEHPPREGEGTFVAFVHPPPEQFFTSGQRRARKKQIDIGSQPSHSVNETINVICQVNRRGTANAQTLLAAKYNMEKETDRIIKANGGTYATNVVFKIGDWQYDDFVTDPTMAISRGLVTAIYFS